MDLLWSLFISQNILHCTIAQTHFPHQISTTILCYFFTWDPSRRVYLHNRDNHTVNHFIDTGHRSQPFSHKTKSISSEITDWRDHCECDQNTNENLPQTKRKEQKRTCESRIYWCLRLPMLIDSVAPKCTIKLFERKREFCIFNSLILCDARTSHLPIAAVYNGPRTRTKSQKKWTKMMKNATNAIGFWAERANSTVVLKCRTKTEFRCELQQLSSVDHLVCGWCCERWMLSRFGSDIRNRRRSRRSRKKNRKEKERQKRDRYARVSCDQQQEKLRKSCEYIVFASLSFISCCVLLHSTHSALHIFWPLLRQHRLLLLFL